MNVMYKPNGTFYVEIMSPHDDVESWKCSNSSNYKWNDTYSYAKENHRYSAIVLKLKLEDKVQCGNSKKGVYKAWCNKTNGKWKDKD